MRKVETQFTAAITAFTVIATASAVLSLRFFVHVNKDDHDKDKDLDFCVLFIKESSANGIKGACDFIISGEAIILALLLTAIGSIAVSICLSPRNRAFKIIALLATLGALVLGIGTASTITAGVHSTCRTIQTDTNDICSDLIDYDDVIAAIVCSWVQVGSTILSLVVIAAEVIIYKSDI